MNLIIIWIGFTVLISMFKELDLLSYVIYNFWVLVLIYALNLLKPSQIPFNIFLLLSSFPSIIICYLILIYGNFLSTNIVKQIAEKDIHTISKHYNNEKTFFNYLGILPTRFSNPTNITRFYKF